MESQAAMKRIAMVGLKERYNDAHPFVVGAVREYEQALRELDKVIEDAVAKIEQDYLTAKLNYASSQRRVVEMEKEIGEMQEQQGKFETVKSKLEELRRVKASSETVYYAEKLKAQGQQASIIEILEPAMLVSQNPINKDIAKNGGLGFLVGGVLGLAIVFGLAFLDDRVKSSADIEGFLGLPLIGVLPIARRGNVFMKARLAASNEDRPVSESFRSTYSALKINEVARNAKVFLVTSTMPGEGKSFVTTNLAITYATHGEKVLIIDADLRLPAIGRTLQLEGENGVTQYFQGLATLDESLHRDVVPNLDVLPLGIPCKNPTQVINSRQFANMITTLKERYDRVFLDSPPIGAVSDCMSLLPQVDGIFYVVRFNTVKRRFIRSNILRIREAKVPIIGAVLNHIGMKVTRYYTNTGDRTYSKYYSRDDNLAETVPVKEY
jgi:capsular exopolysaccharide synthesis family protein